MKDLVAYRWMRWDRWLALVDAEEFSFSDPSTFVDPFETQRDRVFPEQRDGSLIAQEGHGQMFVSPWTRQERSSAMWLLCGKIESADRVEAKEWVVQVAAEPPPDHE